MRIRFGVALILAGLFPPILLYTPLLAREDSASLVFRKTAGVHATRVYVANKGDRIIGIVRSQLGLEKVPYPLIRRLNPGIRDLNRIYPGQRILLPILEKAVSTEPPKPVRRSNGPPIDTYRIQEGDSISRIILAELDLSPAEALSTYRLIRRLNPEITDPNNLPAGGTLNLPPQPGRQQTGPPESLYSEARPAAEAREEMAAKAPPYADGLLGIIRPVIARMRGSLTTRGNYFIPLKENAQLTIDCSLIPVAELPDGTTVLLDFGNRLSEPLKDMVRQSWPNYGFLRADELLDGLASLQGIIRRSRNYAMVRTDRPLSLTAKPEILVYPDWMITANETTGRSPYRQALFLLGEGDRPLPAEVRSFLEKNGLQITEIDLGGALPSPLPSPVSPPAIPGLNGLKGVALAERLLGALGEKPARSIEVAIFDRDRDGFNLSVTVDLLLRKGSKRYILHSKQLPEQFIRSLREAGTEVVFCGAQETGRPFIEGLLRGLNIPVSFGYFFFRIPEESKNPRITAAFSALRVSAGSEPLYLVDFDLPPGAMSLFQGRRWGRFVRY